MTVQLREGFLLAPLAAADDVGFIGQGHVPLLVRATCLLSIAVIHNEYNRPAKVGAGIKKTAATPGIRYWSVGCRGYHQNPTTTAVTTSKAADR